MVKRKVLLGGMGGMVVLCMICLIIGIVYSSTPTYKATATAETIAKAVLTATEEALPTLNQTPLPTETTFPTVTPTVAPLSTPANTPTQTNTSVPLVVPSSKTLLTFIPFISSSAILTVETIAIPAGETITCVPANTDRTEARVVRVVDGDTIEVEINGQVYPLRYIGMDTPENTPEEQPLGAEATAKNKELVEGKTVLIVKDVSETDRYNRLLRYVLVGEIFVNYELVRQGYANPATYPPDVACEETIRQAEREARKEGLGQWAAVVVSQPEPTALPSASGSVAITRIFYDGAVRQVESDEYAEIRNNGSETVNLSGWRLNAGAPGQDFRFPSFDLEPGQSCRIYTDEDHPESCGFNFRSPQAVWNNGGDCGYLFGEKGEKVSETCY